jgi:dephospho-CoA kinase
MLIIGLTGGIGMGKSTAAAHFRACGVPVCDADRIVHDLYAGPAVPAIAAAFPGVVEDGRVDRRRLAAALASPEALARLESIVHPLVQAAEREFLVAAATRGARFAVLEIPLLFETHGHERVDVTVVMSAPPDVQRRRVLARPGASASTLDRLLARQLSDTERRARADFVVDTGGTIAETKRQIDAIIAALQDRQGTAFERFWASPA